MKRLIWLICSGSLLLLLAMVARAETHNLRFVDESGKPISDVVVRVTVVATPPAIGGGGDRKSGPDGRLSVGHPCSTGSGSCCMLVTSVTYQVIGKFGYVIGGGGNLTCGFGTSELTIIGVGQEYPKLSTVSAASYRESLTSEMIVSAFGINLATTTTAAADLPLPTILGGRQVFIRDSDSVERAVRLLFVSPTQINFIMPMQGTGLRTVIVRGENNQVVSAGFPVVVAVAPGVFTANATGQGVPAAIITRVKPDNTQVIEPVGQFDEAQGRFVPIALDLGPESEFVVLSLFGTGWRQASSTAAVEVKIGGVVCPVGYVGKQPTIEGLDQINARLPRTLIGQGDVNVEVKIEGVLANIVQLKFK